MRGGVVAACVIVNGDDVSLGGWWTGIIIVCIVVIRATSCFLVTAVVIRSADSIPDIDGRLLSGVNRR